MRIIQTKYLLIINWLWENSLKGSYDVILIMQKKKKKPGRITDFDG